MLRILLLSDIHSNLQALQSVVDDAGQFDMAFNAGDTVGYGPNPRECVDIVESLRMRSVAGNHDYAAVTGDVSDFNPYAAEAIAINRRLFGDVRGSWLEGLPHVLNQTVEGVRISIFHGSPRDPLNEYVYPEDAGLHADDFLRNVQTDLIVLGHTHVPYIVRSNMGMVLNPGSVGQPRDGDSRASYMILNLGTDGIKVEHRRVEYDIEAVAEGMRRAGLPNILASRLFSGW